MGEKDVSFGEVCIKTECQEIISSLEIISVDGQDVCIRIKEVEGVIFKSYKVQKKRNQLSEQEEGEILDDESSIGNMSDEDGVSSEYSFDEELVSMPEEEEDSVGSFEQSVYDSPKQIINDTYEEEKVEDDVEVDKKESNGNRGKRGFNRVKRGAL